MTLDSLFTDVMWVGIYLIIGFAVREIVKLLQRWFLPSSVIGGIIALVLGPQILNITPIPACFSDFNNVMMRVVMTCVMLGIGFTVKKAKDTLDYTFANSFLYGFQIIVGLLLGFLFSMVWTDMPEGWGVLGMFAYFGMHGTVAAAGGVMEDLGQQGAVAIGLVLATGGLVFSMTVGMFVVNYGVRRGWAKFVKDVQKQPEHFYHGPLPQEERESIGETTTTPASINPLAFHLGIIMVAYFVGWVIFSKILIPIAPVLSKIGPMMNGMVGGPVFWPIMCKLKLDNYCDKKIFNQISGFSLDVLIVGSMASLQLDIVSKYFVPLLLHVLISCTLTVLFCVWYFKKVGSDQWFEKCLMTIGICTGAAPNGLALVRAVDPNAQSCAPESLGVYNALFWWNNLLVPIIPALVITNIALAFGIAWAFVIVSVIMMLVIFPQLRGKKRVKV